MMPSVAFAGSLAAGTVMAGFKPSSKGTFSVAKAAMASAPRFPMSVLATCQTEIAWRKNVRLYWTRVTPEVGLDPINRQTIDEIVEKKLIGMGLGTIQQHFEAFGLSVPRRDSAPVVDIIRELNELQAQTGDFQSLSDTASILITSLTGVLQAALNARPPIVVPVPTTDIHDIT